MNDAELKKIVDHVVHLSIENEWVEFKHNFILVKK